MYLYDVKYVYLWLCTYLPAYHEVLLTVGMVLEWAEPPGAMESTQSLVATRLDLMYTLRATWGHGIDTKRGSNPS